MERFLLYWDDLDDLVGALALKGESIRRLVLFALSAAVFLLLLGAAVVLAMREPPLALAFVTILSVMLLYRSATQQRTVRVSVDNR